MPSDTPPTAPPGGAVKLPPKRRPPLLDYALPVTSAASGVMLGLAVPSIIDASSLADYAKALTLTVSGIAVSYGVNKLAVERGAELGTTGYHGATVAALSSIVIVGGGLAAATFAGLTLKDTAKLDLQAHGHALSIYVGERSSAASSAARITPAIRATEADLTAKADCENRTSCISGHRNGGNGTVAKIVQVYAGRAGSIGQQITAGEAAREQIAKRLNDDLASYHTALADESVTANERRARAQTIDARIRQGIGELDVVVPLSLVSAYASELQSPVSVPGRPEAGAALSGILSRHGRSLSAVLEGIKETKSVPPAFPGQPGVGRTFAYLLQFAPIALIAFVVDLVLPLVLFAYTYWSLAWKKHNHDPDGRGGGDAGPVDPPLSDPPVWVAPVTTDTAPEPARRGRPPRRVYG